MAVKSFKPTSPGRRFQTVSTFEEITTDKPEKSLLVPLKRSGGRNCYGRVTARYIGGGHKKMYRIIDLKRDKRDIPATVATIEYDPNRTSRIALLNYKDGEKRYILAPKDLVGGRCYYGRGRGRVPAGQCASHPAYPHRHADSQYRAEAGKGRTDCAQRRFLRADHG